MGCGFARRYDSGFIHVYIHHDEWNNNHMMNDEQRKMINDTKAVLHLNRCMCRVKMEKWDDALWDADKAVQFSGKPGNPKAYVRGGVGGGGDFGSGRKEDWLLLSGCARPSRSSRANGRREDGISGSPPSPLTLPFSLASLVRVGTTGGWSSTRGT
jgi:hypothetical protein